MEYFCYNKTSLVLKSRLLQARDTSIQLAGDIDNGTDIRWYSIFYVGW